MIRSLPLALAAAWPMACPALAGPPNIVVILADDMGFSDLGCYGGEIATPNLDALAAGGVRFTQFDNSARCCPSRASLLTGLYPHQTGVGHMMEDRGLDGYRGDLNARCRTIAEVLRPAGYRSYAGRGWANVSNTPFRESKHRVHEGGISTPLIAHWPAGIPARGELRREPGHLIDVMATCVELAGAAYPADSTPPEGRSLAPAFVGKPLGREALFWEHEGNRAVRAGRWKLVSRQDRPWELYDMEADRTELSDLATRMPEKVVELSARWDEWARRTHVVPAPPTPKEKEG